MPTGRISIAIALAAVLGLSSGCGPSDTDASPYDPALDDANAPSEAWTRDAISAKVVDAATELENARETINQFYQALRERKPFRARAMLVSPDDIQRQVAVATDLGWTSEQLDAGTMTIEVTDVFISGHIGAAMTVRVIEEQSLARPIHLIWQDGDWLVCPPTLYRDARIQQRMTENPDDARAVQDWIAATAEMKSAG